MLTATASIPSKSHSPDAIHALPSGANVIF